MRSFRSVLSKISGVLLSILLFCNDSYGQPESFKFEKLSSQFRLSGTSISCFDQDSLGFVWIGTNGGLNRLDGEKIKVYKHVLNDSTSLISNSIKKIFFDSKSRMWLITQDGIARYHEDLDRFENYRLYYNSELSVCFDLVEDHDGRIMVLVNDSKLFLYNEGINDFKFFKHIPIESEADLMVWHDKLLYVSSRKSFLAMDLETDSCMFYHKLKPLKGYPSYQISTMKVIDNKLWLAGYGIELHFLDFSNGKLNTIADPHIVSVDSYDDETILMCGISGVYAVKTTDYGKILPMKYVLGDEDDFLVNNSNIWVDRKQTVWVKSETHGVLYALKDQLFFDDRTLAESLFKSYNTMISMQLLPDGHTIWLGGFSGAIHEVDVLENSHEILNLGHGNPLYPSDKSTFKIFCDSKDDVWLATYHGGLKHIDIRTNEIEWYKHDPEVPNTLRGNDIRDIVEDKEGYLWLGVHGWGVDKFDPRTERVVQYYGAGDSATATLLTAWPRDLLHAFDGGIWIGSNTGIQVIKGNDISSFNFEMDNPKGLSNNNVNCIYQDSDSNIWVGTRGGLNLFNEKDTSFTQINTSHGLIDDYVTSIIEGDEGDIWLATGNGISILTMYEQDSFAIENMEISEGNYSNQFVNNGVLKVGDTLFYSTTTGILYFDINNIKKEVEPPRLFFENLELFNRKITICEEGSSKREEFCIEKQANLLEELILEHDQNSVSIEFGSISYTQHTVPEYCYKLEGFDREWIDADYNVASYTSLPPGEYTFMVKVKTKDNESTSSRSLPILIKKPFHQTYYGIAIIVLLLLALLMLAFFVVSERIKLIEKGKKEKEIGELKTKFFTNVSHELKTPLSLIIGPLRTVLQKPDEGTNERYINLALKNAESLLKLVNRLLELRRLETNTLKITVQKGDVVFLAKEIYESFSSLAEKYEITFVLDNQLEESYYCWYDPDIIERVLFNLLSNAFKFTPRHGEIVLSMNVITSENDVDRLELMVKDSGLGMDEETQKQIFKRFIEFSDQSIRNEQGTGIGLSIVKEMVALHRGDVSFTSSEGLGTSFKVVIPVDKMLFAPLLKDDSPVTKDLVHEPIREEVVENEVGITWENGEKPTLLVVEDNEELREFIAGTLDGNFEVFTAENGQIGLEKALEAMPDLIISDVMMPVMDGMALLKELKADVRTDHIPVLMLTAHSRDDSQLTAFGAGAHDYLIKPFNPQLLIAKISNIVSDRKKWQEKLSDPTWAEQPTEVAPKNEFLTKFYDILRQNLTSSKINSEALSRELGVSRSQLYRKIAALTGKTMGELVKNYRLQTAARLLSEGHKSSEVGSMIGYTDRTGFYRAFKAHFGISPSAYKPE